MKEGELYLFEDDPVHFGGPGNATTASNLCCCRDTAPPGGGQVA